MKNENLYKYILGIADNTLILGQRMAELCGHGPSLEVDIACTNISLDLLGQTRSYYQYAAKVKGEDKVTEDSIAFLRKERDYKNVLLVEQPNGDFAHIMARLFFFGMFYEPFLEKLANGHDLQLTAIAKKAIKEVRYHNTFSSDWVRRLGDGTEESHRRMQNAIDTLWPYSQELFDQTENDSLMIESGVGVAVTQLKDAYCKEIGKVLQEATLTVPEDTWFHKGGKRGVHSEHMGYILSDLQYMQRTYPDMQW